MKQKLKILLRVVLILCVTFLITNCTNESSSENKINSISEAHNWFNEYESSSENYSLFQSLDYDWNEAKITTSEDGTETIIVPVNEAKSDSRDFWEQRLYIYKTGKEDYKVLVYEIYTNKNLEEQSRSFEGGNFTGFVSVWDLKYGFVRAARFENNKVIETGVVEVIDYNKRSETNKAPTEPPCIYADFGDGGCGGLSGGNTGIPLREVIINNPSKGTPVEYYGPRGPVTGGGDTGSYTSPHSGGGSSGGNGITAPSPLQIKDYLTGKAKCINDLLNKNGNSYIKNLLSNFEGTSKFDITISSVDALPKTVDGEVTYLNGRTLKPKGNLIQIEISTTEANKRAPLEVARIILHEYIHADIYRKLGTVLAMNADNLDFKETYEKYEGEQHSVMAKLYVDSMKEALKNFHQTLFPADIKAYTDYYNEAPSDAFYEALAWGGLRDENVKAWNELSAAKKATIEALASRVEKFSKTSPCTN